MDGDADNSELVARVSRCIDRHALIPPRAGVVVGVSGGADSVALLAVLQRLAGEARYGWRLTAAHLNHNIRPGSADDEAFVRSLASDLGTGFVGGSEDVPAQARQWGWGIEQAARKLRYDFLLAAARRVGASHVAVAHHRDDNAETILYRIVRGTHLRGLAGMPIRRPLEGSEVTLVRPLLEASRAQTEQFCRQNSLPWRTDESNRDTSYRRNFIRHELLPLLQRVNIRADEALLRLGQGAGEVEQFLAGLGGAALARATREHSPRRQVLDRPMLATEHPVVRAYALREAVERMGVPMRTFDAARLAELADLLLGGEAPPRTAVALPGQFRASLAGTDLILEAAPSDAPTPVSCAAAILECPGSVELAGLTITCRRETLDPAAFAEHCRCHPHGVELVDASQIRGPLLCRPRNAGDEFHPLGADSPRSVNDFLKNQKIPRTRRDTVVCVCDDLGVVYLAPLRIDQRVRVGQGTQSVLRLSVAGGPAGGGDLGACNSPRAPL